MARDYVLQGGDGVISVTANVAPATVAKVMAAAAGRDAIAAQAADAKLAALHRDLFCEANPIPVKWAVAALGRMHSGQRLPLTELDPEFQPALVEAMELAGLRAAAAAAA